VGIQERKLHEKELRRKAIMDAGSELFKQVGFNNTSMDMVAEKAQLSKGTLYLYFKSKDDLYANCILEDGLKYLSAFFEEVEKKSKTVEETIIGYADAYYKFTNEFHELFNMLMGVDTAASFDLNNVSEETKEKILSLQKKIFTERIDFLNNATDKGVLRDGFSACYTVVQLWVSIVGALHLSTKKQLSFMFEKIDSKEFIRDIAKIFVMAYTKDDELKHKLQAEISENAVKQAPSAIDVHHKILNKKKEENN
jgi:AcrR family transcriptional regulator